MRRKSLFGLVLIVLALATACGPAGGTPTPQATPTSPPEPTLTSAEASAPASESGEVQVIEIIADANGYNPSVVKVKAGSQVRFIITNVDNELHDLWNRRANFDVGVAAGQTKTYDWVAPHQKRSYVAECTLHEGLTLTIIVE